MRSTPRRFGAALACLAAAGCSWFGSGADPGGPSAAAPAGPSDGPPAAVRGPWLRNIRRITVGGPKNGEGYFSPDGRRIVFQGVPAGEHYYRMYTMNADGGGVARLSSGEGKTTCGFFSPDGRHAIYASTHLDPRSARQPPPKSDRYAWDFDPAFDIFRCDPDGSNLVRLTDAPGYDAECAYSPDGRNIVFTSNRDGDLEIYVMDADGSRPRRITHEPGYDGGPFFSPDGKQIVYRHFTPDESSARIMVADFDPEDRGPIDSAQGKPKAPRTRELTHFPTVSWCPFFHPDGKRIVFASNVDDRGNFELFLVRTDGTDLVRLTHSDGFDGLPAFSPDGRLLLWTSTRWDGTSQLTAADFMDEPPPAGNPDITAEDARRRIGWLAGDELEGRKAGALGAEMAASYVGGEFRRLGLKPGGDDGTYFQVFAFPSGSKLGPGNRLSIRVGNETIEGRPGMDFRPLRLAKNATVEADAVAVGYGIVTTDGSEDDYTGWEVAGRVAVALDGAPDGWADKHVGQGLRLTAPQKAAAAAEKKVAALLVVGELGRDTGNGAPFHLAGEAAVPVVRVAKKFWDDVLAKAGGADVKLRVSLATEIVRESQRTCNVIGVWPGESDETVVLGAHVDHLGRGIPLASRTENRGKIHFGADDNASGTAGMLEVAQAVAASGKPLPRTVVFMGFGAEEIGLLGSQHFVNHPTLPLEKIVAMINLDMIGRVRAGKISLEGVGTSPFWAELVPALEKDAPFKMAKKPGGFGPSDQTSFCAKKIPVLFFFTGLHEQYHKPTDTPDLIDYEGLAAVARLAREAVEATAKAPGRPAFAEVPAPPEAAHGTRAYLGVIPDYTEDAEGVLLSGVQPGGPAEKAGLHDQDLIVRVHKTAVKGIEDLHNALTESKPGDEVEIEVVRSGKREVLKAKLGRRPEEQQ